MSTAWYCATWRYSCVGMRCTGLLSITFINRCIVSTRQPSCHTWRIQAVVSSCCCLQLTGVACYLLLLSTSLCHFTRMLLQRLGSEPARAAYARSPTIPRFARLARIIQMWLLFLTVRQA